mmetsp:Transcript_19093/g.41597  ORF Transcript_19093/g.41597 Transcript_19093/m.41597 type:complete len:720 (+) Transcript_19093:56-2215(+)
MQGSRDYNLIPATNSRSTHTRDMPPLHRSRIRRRSANHQNGPATAQPIVSGVGVGDGDGDGSSSSIRSSIPRHATSIILLSLLLSLPSTSQAAYLGPTHCTKQGVSAASAIQRRKSPKGYSTFNHLLFDMVSISTSFESGLTVPEERLTFKICRGSVIDLDDSSLPLGFLPIKVPRITLQCGDSGLRTGGSSSPSFSSSSFSSPSSLSDVCIIRGGGKRNPDSSEWNTYPQKAFKNSASGILGGGGVAQIYVYGESAYEITLRGLTFDNSVSQSEVRMYDEYVAQFGKEALGDDVDFSVSGGKKKGKESTIEEEYDASVPTMPDESSSLLNNWGGADQLKNDKQNNRNLQREEEEDGIKPAHRFASVAVRGKGFGDDAGPRLITIENCRFESHRGYAVLVSPGIQRPDLPTAPAFEFRKPVPQQPPSPQAGNGGVAADNAAAENTNIQSSGQIYNGGNRGQRRRRLRRRRLNLLDDGAKFIPEDGLVAYYDRTPGENYLDGRRVKISNSEFANNRMAGDNVAGLVTSAYSLTVTNCFFRENDAKAMVFVYNDDAIVDGTVFAENKVEVSTVIMASPRGGTAEPAQKGSGGGPATVAAEPTHIVERSCFVGSHVGMSNVLVTDVEDTGFGQRDNHARGTEFTWVSDCEGGAAEQFGHDCLETGRCDGTCIQFTSEKCMSERADSREYAMLFSAGNRTVERGGLWGMTLVFAVVLGACVFF